MTESSRFYFDKAAMAAAREAAGMSLTEAAEHVGRSPSTVNGWETGKSIPRLHDAAALAALYGVPLTDFILRYERVAVS